MSQGRSQQTERATPRKLEKSREKGQVPRSREIGSALSLTLFLLAMWAMGAEIVEKLKVMLTRALQEDVVTGMTMERAHGALNLAAAQGSLVLMPIIAAVLGSVVLSTALQGGPVFSAHPLKLSFNRLNPVQGLRPILTGRKGMEALMILVKASIFVTVAWTALVAELPGIVALSTSSVPQILVGLARLVGRILMRMALVGLLMAGIDYLWQRWRFMRDQRMSKQEIKDERKESDGNPLIKGKIRSKMQALSRRRLSQEIRKATVVVVNPTHVAVAMRYAPMESAAPRLVAKGTGRLAQRIRDLARENGVPIVTDPPLARLLQAAVNVGQEIPEALYKAVAGVLAFVTRRKKGEAGAYRREVSLPDDLPLGPAAQRAARRAYRRDRRDQRSDRR